MQRFVPDTTNRAREVDTYDRCGKVQMVNQPHSSIWDGMPIRDLLPKMRHDGCADRPGKAELLTGIEGVSSRSVRRIVLREGETPLSVGITVIDR